MKSFMLIILIILIVLTFFIAKVYTKLLNLKKPYLFVFLYILLLILIIRFIRIPLVEENSILFNIGLYGASFYLVLITISTLGFLIYSFILHISKRAPSKQLLQIFACSLMVCSLMFTAFCSYQAKQIRVTTYHYNINKQTNIKELNIVYISDIHLGNSVGENELETIVEKVNQIKPDVILFGGDIFDENSTEDQLNKSIPFFKRLKATDGIFYIYGNHEFYTSSQERYNKILNDSNITIIKDSAIEVNDNYNLIGRLDQRKNKNRKPLSSLLNDIDTSKPVILLDHQPIVEDNNLIDFQLSGHTHNGQIFPGNILTSLIYNYSYGLYNSPSHPILVSSGAGTYGIPLRFLTNSEIVNLRISFK